MTIIDTTSDTVTAQFVEEDINRPTGKLTDCQAPFVGSSLRISIPDRRGPDPIQCTVSLCRSLVVVRSSFK